MRTTLPAAWPGRRPEHRQPGPPQPPGHRARHRALHRNQRRPHPIHYDAELAAATRFGGIVVQGGVTSALLNALVAEDLPGPGTVFLQLDLRFLAGVRPGDEITAEAEVVAVRPDKPITELAVSVTTAMGCAPSKDARSATRSRCPPGGRGDGLAGSVTATVAAPGRLVAVVTDLDRLAW
jgi:hypothetical protein